MRLLAAALVVTGAGCSQLMPAPKQEPFPLMEVKAEQAIAALRLDKPPGERIQLESVPIKFEWSNP